MVANEEPLFVGGVLTARRAVLQDTLVYSV